jgi:hypothetical protein
MFPLGPRSLLAAALLVVGLAHSTAMAQTPTAPADQARPCVEKSGLTHLTHPLAHMAQRIANGKPITIVALGSSSTAGAGASGPAASYPSRLEAELKARFPEQSVTVINQGVNGEEAGEMLARFEESVARAHPDLVLWQVGTNAVLRDNPLGPVDRLVHDGIARMKALGTDVVLIDPQFAPKVIDKADELWLHRQAPRREHLGSRNAAVRLRSGHGYSPRRPARALIARSSDFGRDRARSSRHYASPDALMKSTNARSGAGTRRRPG